MSKFDVNRFFNAEAGATFFNALYYVKKWISKDKLVLSSIIKYYAKFDREKLQFKEYFGNQYIYFPHLYSEFYPQGMNDKSAYQCNLFLKTIDDTLNVLYAMFDEHFVTYYCLETKQLKIFDKDMNELKFDIVKL